VAHIHVLARTLANALAHAHAHTCVCARASIHTNICAYLHTKSSSSRYCASLASDGRATEMGQPFTDKRIFQACVISCASKQLESPEADVHAPC